MNHHKKTMTKCKKVNKNELKQIINLIKWFNLNKIEQEAILNSKK
jgi:hypothetical protein